MTWNFIYFDQNLLNQTYFINSQLLIVYYYVIMGLIVCVCVCARINFSQYYQPTL